MKTEKSRWSPRTCRTLLLMACALLIALAGMPAPKSAAESKDEGIEMFAEVGLAGTVREGKWTRLKLTMTNKTYPGSREAGGGVPKPANG